MRTPRKKDITSIHETNQDNIYGVACYSSVSSTFFSVMISRCIGSVLRCERSRLAELSFPVTYGDVHVLERTMSTSAEGGRLLRNDETASGITTLTLNNPRKYNVLSWELLDALQKQLDDIATDSVRIQLSYLIHSPNDFLELWRYFSYLKLAVTSPFACL